LEGENHDTGDTKKEEIGRQHEVDAGAVISGIDVALKPIIGRAIAIV